MNKYIDYILGITMIGIFVIAFIGLVGWIAIDLMVQFKELFGYKFHFYEVI